MEFSSNDNSLDGLTDCEIKRHILAIALSPYHVDAGNLNAEYIAGMYGYEEADVDSAIVELENAGLLDIVS